MVRVDNKYGLAIELFRIHLEMHGEDLSDMPAELFAQRFRYWFKHYVRELAVVAGVELVGVKGRKGGVG